MMSNEKKILSILHFSTTSQLHFWGSCARVYLESINSYNFVFRPIPALPSQRLVSSRLNIPFISLTEGLSGRTNPKKGTDSLNHSRVDNIFCFIPNKYIYWLRPDPRKYRHLSCRSGLFHFPGPVFPENIITSKDVIPCPVAKSTRFGMTRWACPQRL